MLAILYFILEPQAGSLVAKRFLRVEGMVVKSRAADTSLLEVDTDQPEEHEGA